MGCPEPLADVFFFEDFCGPEQRQTLTSVTSSGIDKADGIPQVSGMRFSLSL